MVNQINQNSFNYMKPIPQNRNSHVHLPVSKGFLSSKIYDTRDKFYFILTVSVCRGKHSNFYILWRLYFKSDYFARVLCHVAKFNARNTI